jgi:hypothetical protein
MWNYQTKLDYLNQHGESFIGRLGVASKPHALESKNLPFHVLSVEYYDGEETTSESGRFSQEDITEILQSSEQPNLDALNDANLEVHIRACVNHLWGFRLTPDSKIWIAEYQPHQLRF